MFVLSGNKSKEEQTMVAKSFPVRIQGLRRRASVGTSGDGLIRLTPLLQLAKQGRFEKIEEIFMNSSDACISAWIENCDLSKGDSDLRTFKGETMLHMIMVHQPPASVVDMLIRSMMKKRPETVPEAATDMQSRTPLHLAVAHDCDIAVIDRLMNGVVAVVPAVTKDMWHRLPLHWACANPNGSSEESWSLCCASFPQSTYSDNMIKTIEALVKAYPHATFVKDRGGLTPLDLAAKNFADPCVLHLLANVSKSNRSAPGVVDLSHSETDDTSQTDIPLEVPSAQLYNSDFEDDVSSMGTGGVSRCARNRNIKKPTYRRPLPYIYEQIDI